MTSEDVAAGGGDEASADLRQQCFRGNDVLQSAPLCFLMNHDRERRSTEVKKAHCGLMPPLP